MKKLGLLRASSSFKNVPLKDRPGEHPEDPLETLWIIYSLEATTHPLEVNYPTPGGHHLPPEGQPPTPWEQPPTT